MDLKVRTKSHSGRSYEWLASAKGTDTMRTVTVDLDTFDFVTGFPTKVIPAGRVLGKVTANSKYGPYADLGTNEVQTVTITGSPTGGTFTLTYAGQTTAAIAYNAAASAVATALAALSNLDAQDIALTGGPGPGTAYVVTFIGADAGGMNQPEMTATGSFTGGTAPAVAVTTTTAGAAGATDGRQTAVGILFETIDVSHIEGTDLTGDVVVPLLVEGFINESALPTGHGLDAAAKVELAPFFRFF